MSLFLQQLGHLPLRRSRRKSIAKLSKVKRWQWFSLSLVLSGVVAWRIYETGAFAGAWGILNEEIAVVTVESDKDGGQNITIKDPSKSFWDVLEVLGVPLVLAVLGAWFQRTQREQEADEAREEVLQLYFDRVSMLLVDKNLMAIAIKQREIAAARTQGMLAVSINTNEEELLEVSIGVIQARTLSILRRFEQDSERKTSVVRFLTEADITSRLKVRLSGTDLSYVNLSHVNLRGVNLSGADLRDADLNHADLRGADLSYADLRGVKLSYADLRDADVSRAKLGDSNLEGADLRGANLLKSNFHRAHMSYAKLCHANLSGAILSKVRRLTKEQLSQAILCSPPSLMNLTAIQTVIVPNHSHPIAC